MFGYVDVVDGRKAEEGSQGSLATRGNCRQSHFEKDWRQIL